MIMRQSLYRCLALLIVLAGNNLVGEVSPVYVQTAYILKAGRMTYLSPSGGGPSIYNGTISAVSGATIEDESADWSEDAYDNGTYYLELSSGEWKGKTVAIVDTQSSGALVTAEDLSGIAVAGNTYRIRQGLRLSDIFGPNNKANLVEGPNASEADQVLIFDGETQQPHGYFYKTDVGWRDAADTMDAALVALAPHLGFMIESRGEADRTIYIQTRLKNTESLTPILPGFNVVGSQRAYTALKLSESGLHQQLQGGFNPKQADNLFLVDQATGAVRRYFYLSGTGITTPGWYDMNYSPSGDVSISPGTAIIIERKNGEAFYWSCPPESNP